MDAKLTKGTRVRFRPGTWLAVSNFEVDISGLEAVVEEVQHIGDQYVFLTPCLVSGQKLGGTWGPGPVLASEVLDVDGSGPNIQFGPECEDIEHYLNQTEQLS